jgi:hypothetical protein
MNGYEFVSIFMQSLVLSSVIHLKKKQLFLNMCTTEEQIVKLTRNKLISEGLTRYLIKLLITKCVLILVVIILTFFFIL